MPVNKYSSAYLASNPSMREKIRQRGVSLIELLVGIAIGLLVVAVAGGALMVSRGISGTVSDASELQQQAGYVFRVIGLQMRQAGGISLNLSIKAGLSENAETHMQPVAFETTALPKNANGFDVRKADHRLTGTSESLNIGYMRYSEAVFNPANASRTNEYLSRNCLGGPQDISANDIYHRVESIFTSSDGDLRCRGNSQITAQPVIGNLANFRVRYLIQQAANTGNPSVQYVSTVSASEWEKVVGAEVCIVLHGNEKMALPSSSEYTDCDGTTKVNMSNAASKDMNGVAIGENRAGRIHMVFRHVYQLRSQGLVGSVL